MASTEEMRRIVLHAAGRLSEELDGYTGHGDRSTLMAMAYAHAVLEMVAACMDDDADDGAAP